MWVDRYHGLGNVYLVAAASQRPWTPAAVVAVCDLATGVGAEGLLEARTAAAGEDAAVTIWNPDGSQAEKSGNGLRIFAHWLRREGLVGDGAMQISTGPCRVVAEVTGDEVVVDMGQASVDPAAIGLQASAPWCDEPVVLGGGTQRVSAISVGNPHAVVWTEAEDLDATDFAQWAGTLATSAHFEHGTNVQLAAVRGPDVVEIRIWERGAGPTPASGSSSCAVVASAVQSGRLKPGQVTVHMPGGSLEVTVRRDLTLRLRGPVERVGRVQLDPAWCAARGL